MAQTPPSIGKEKSGDFPSLVVGVGASAGGLDAFKDLLSHLPDEPGMAFLIVQHLDPSHDSVLSDLLAPCTAMTVRDADHGALVEQNCVYIIRPDTALGVRNGRLELTAPRPRRGARLSVDHLFRSLAREYGARAVGVVLSGAGADGSSGLRAIRAEGGLIIAQDPSTCGHPSMPRSAIGTGLVDVVLPIGDMPGALHRFANLPSEARERLDEPPRDASTRVDPILHAQDLDRVASVLAAHRDFDLRVYKPATVERRLLRRLGLSGFDALEPYIEALRVDPEEQQALMRDMLISVTEFFRDPDAFAALREQVIEPLVTNLEDGQAIRIWVAGCATGEEAYSIGMEVLDAMDDHGVEGVLQMFATDIDESALAFAREAVYPPDRLQSVSKTRLTRYFRRLDGKGYEVSPHLRDHISFAAHDLTKDPPFSRMDLVSCRNVLIYLTPAVQRHVLNSLHFALDDERSLFLSTSETTSQQRDLFSTLSKKHRIYRKLGASRAIAIQRSTARRRPHDARLEPAPRRQAPDDAELARRAALRAALPPTVVVTGGDQVVYTFGELSPFLRFPEDDGPRLDLGALLRPGISTRTRGALYKCRQSREKVVAYATRDASDDHRVRIVATPARGMTDDAVVLNFQEVPASAAFRDRSPDSSSTDEDAVIARMERELQATREDLRTTVEELETSNEELRSSNEESMSMNEELQSTNEELEATSEELRSLNEELTTVNAQLREKVEQLEHAHDDLNNFFSSTHIATVFLDDALRIKRFTPRARQLLGIDHGDEGRVVDSFARELLQHDLHSDAQAVLEHLTSRTREIVLSDGRWFTRRVLPYRTESRRIEGVVVTFSDITALKSASVGLEQALARENVVVRLGIEALSGPPLLPFLDKAVREIQACLGADLCKVLETQPKQGPLLLRAGVGWEPGLAGSATVDAGMESQAGFTLQSSAPVVVDDLAAEARFSGPPLLVDHGVVSGLSCIIGEPQKPFGVLGAHWTSRREISSEDADFLQSVATVLASAIQRHQHRRNTRLELGVAQLLATIRSRDRAIQAVLELMGREFGAPVVVEWWWRRDGTPERGEQFVLPPSARASVDEAIESSDVSPDLVTQCQRDGTARWVTDHTPHPGYDLMESEHLGLRSLLCVPVVAGDQPLGAIGILSSARLFTSPALLRNLESIGRIIGAFLNQLQSAAALEELAAITASSQDAIFSYDLAGTILNWLPGAERLFGFEAEEMVGESIERVVPDEASEVLWRINEQILLGESLDPWETERIDADGERIAVSVQSTAVSNAEGEIVAISEAARDIRHRKATEQLLRTSDRRKDEFIAMLGHELRNPLAAIRTASDLLDSGAPEHAARAQEIIRRQTLHTSQLLDDLLDVSRFIRGKIRLDEETLDFAGLCRDACRDHAPRASDRGLDLQLAIGPEPVWVTGDRVRLTQVVDNLLSNACKFTSAGGQVRIAVEVRDDHAVLTVSDDGVGIEPELLPDIFRVFHQSEQNLARSKGGLGLGLALCKSLVDIHGGRIDADSDGRGEGARFTVWLPVATAPSEPRPPEKRQPGGPLSVLVVEDNEDAAAMMQILLTSWGHDVRRAPDAERGISMAIEQPPDIVLCDIGLPGDLSGFDVARQLREVEKLRHVQLIAISGYGSREHRDEAMRAGFDALATKPVDADQLQRMLAEVDGD